MVLHSPGETVALIHKIAGDLRRRPTLAARRSLRLTAT
jgi:exodeoxyribonuclease-5